MAEHQIERLHAACDECRTRKLKCSGGKPQCSRCTRERIRCVYSPQKQMGRPRKRRRDECNISNEQTRPNPSEPILVNVSAAPNFGDFGLASPQTLNDFSGYADFHGHDSLPSSHVSVLHDDSNLGNAYGHEHAPLDFSIDPMIDPSLWNAQPNGAKIGSDLVLTPAQQQETPCTCLSIMYLTISELQTISSFAFPAVIVPLRRALTTAATMLRCEKCPKEPFTAIQNVQSLTALMSAIAERFHKVLTEVDAEASRLELLGGKKLFRAAENNPTTLHLHTGDLNCPMGFDIELEARDWRKHAKRAIKTEVMGGGPNPTPLNTLLNLMEQRQRHWHSHQSGMLELDARIRIFGAQTNCVARGDDATCLRMVNQIRSMVDNMSWD